MSPEDLLLDLIETVIGMNVHAGITNALDSKLQNAVDALDRAKAGFDTSSSALTIHSPELRISSAMARELGDPGLSQAVLGSLTVSRT